MENCYHQHINQETALKIILKIPHELTNYRLIRYVLNPFAKQIYKKKTRANANTKKRQIFFENLKADHVNGCFCY